MSLLYVDPQSPYAYLAEARATAVLGEEPELRPVLLGAIFAKRGHGSWAFTDDREAHVAEVAGRAAAAGLPPVRWPADWPAQTLDPVRACTWAHLQGAGRPWLRAYWRRVFAEGAAAGAPATLALATEDAGLHPGALPAALRDEAVKRQVRAWTEQAWEDGVRGIPTLSVAGRLFYGDDQLEAAARARAAALDPASRDERRAD